MNKIKFELEHCYGINKLNFELDFSNNNTNIIYASNGTMKTSFADTMDAISKGIIPRDRIGNIEGTTNIIVDDMNLIKKDEILVIEAEKINDNMEENTSLLASKELKKEYDSIYSIINKKLDELMKKIKKVSGLSQEEFFEIGKNVIFNNSKTMFDIFNYINKNVKFEDFADDKLQNIKYKEIFNKDTEKLFSNQEFINLIKEYIEKYNEIFKNSEIFVKGKFNHYNAEVVSKNLNDNGYFTAGHKIKLRNSKDEINDSEQFNLIIEEEKNRELENEELKERFNKIDEMLKSPAGIRKFKEYLLENRKLLHYISNVNDLKKTILLNYIIINKDEYDNLMIEYNMSKENLKKILDKAKLQVTEWHKVKDLFKSRFFVPFDIEVKNKEDVILKEQRLSIEYKYENNPNEVSKDNMIECLSTGEKKAYYILNLLYELEKAKSLNKNIFIVLDDLADSFDYRNKYAIIEYLCDLQKVSNFKVLILTHNFDFYRTVSNRLNLKGKNAFFAIKNENEISIQEGKYFENIFFKWKNNIYENKKIFISSIPFVRNISEYMDGRKNNKIYKELTNVLHMKQIDTKLQMDECTYTIKKTNDINVFDIIDIFVTVWNIDRQKMKYNNDKIIDLVIEVADDIVNNTSDNDVLLENKVVLSMGIRLKAELYMIKRIKNDNFVNSIEENQTRLLFEKIIFNNTPEDLKIKVLLSQVLLMTSENIHLNSFMYEPIIDMSIEHLKKLYKEISSIEKGEN